MRTNAFPERLSKIEPDIAGGEDCSLVVEDGVTRTEIDLRRGLIRKAWHLMGFAHQKTYALGDYASAEIRDESILIEGYTVPSFCVHLAGRGGRIRLFAAGTMQEARLIEGKVAAFLRGTACSGSPAAPAESGS